MQAVSCFLVTVEALVQIQASPRESDSRNCGTERIYPHITLRIIQPVFSGSILSLYPLLCAAVPSDSLVK